MSETPLRCKEEGMKDESSESSRRRETGIASRPSLRSMTFPNPSIFVMQTCIFLMAKNYYYLVRFKHFNLDILFFIMSATYLNLFRKTVEEG